MLSTARRKPPGNSVVILQCDELVDQRAAKLCVYILLAQMAGLQASGKRIVGDAVEGGMWCAVVVRGGLQTRLAAE